MGQPDGPCPAPGGAPEPEQQPPCGPPQPRPPRLAPPRRLAALPGPLAGSLRGAGEVSRPQPGQPASAERGRGAAGRPVAVALATGPSQAHPLALALPLPLPLPLLHLPLLLSLPVVLALSAVVALPVPLPLALSPLSVAAVAVAVRDSTPAIPALAVPAVGVWRERRQAGQEGLKEMGWGASERLPASVLSGRLCVLSDVGSKWHCCKGVW